MRTLPLAFAALAGCGGNTAVTDAAVDAGSGFNFETGEVTDATTGYGIAGATVCLIDRAQCTTADGSGIYSWNLPVLPPGTPTAMSIAAGGHLGAVVLEDNPNGVAVYQDLFALLPDSLAATTYGSDCGFDLSGSAGLLVIRVAVEGSGETEVSGATVSISPATGSGPVYAGSDGVYSTALASTAPDGAAAFGDLGSGFYDVTVTSPDGGPCTTGGSGLFIGDWPPGSDAPGSTTRVQVVPGFVTTNVDVVCD